MHQIHVIVLFNKSSIDILGSFHSSVSDTKLDTNLMPSQSTPSSLSSTSFFPSISSPPITVRSHSMPSVPQPTNISPSAAFPYSTTQPACNSSHQKMLDYIMANIDKIPDNRDKPMHLGLPLPDDELESLLQMVCVFVSVLIRRMKRRRRLVQLSEHPFPSISRIINLPIFILFFLVLLLYLSHYCSFQTNPLSFLSKITAHNGFFTTSQVQFHEHKHHLHSCTLHYRYTTPHRTLLRDAFEVAHGSHGLHPDSTPPDFHPMLQKQDDGHWETSSALRASSGAPSSDV